MAMPRGRPKMTPMIAGTDDCQATVAAS
jgi:hypothetical protein